MIESSTSQATYLSFFVHAADVLAQSLDYQETLQNVAASAVATVADLCIVDLGEVGETRMVAAAQRDASEIATLNALEAHLQRAEGRPVHPVSRVLASGKTFFAPVIDDRWIEEHASGPEHAAFMRHMRYRSMLVVPLASPTFGLRGALTLVTVEGGRSPFDASAVTFTEAFGRMCASAIGKAQTYAEAYSAAALFQNAALPQHLPQREGLEIFSYYQPASRGQIVGGDWYDAFVIPDGRIGISVGDVAGHGLHAAVSMGSIRNALRTALLTEPDLGRALSTVDHLVRTEYRTIPFCTAMLALLDLDAMTLRLASAGHPGPRIFDAARNVVLDPFTQRDLPLGVRMMPHVPVPPRSIRLEGGLVVFYTDGLVECTRNVVEGEAALNQTMLRADVREAADPALAIRNAMTECGSNPKDDIAIMVLRFAPSLFARLT